MHKIVHFPFSPIRVNATCTLGHDRSRTFDAGAATFASIERLKQPSFLEDQIVVGVKATNAKCKD